MTNHFRISSSLGYWLFKCCTLLLCCSASSAQAQKVWVAFDDYRPSDSIRLYSYTTYLQLADCTSGTRLRSPSNYYAITLADNIAWTYGLHYVGATNSYVHGLTGGIFLYQPFVFVDTVLVIAGAPVIATSPNDTLLNAMTCDYEGLVYAAGQGISVFNPADSSISYRGPLPPGLASAGGMTYRNGEFFLSTVGNSLARVDVENPVNTVEIAQFPPGTPPIDALVSFPYRCDSIVTYAFARAESSTTIYRLDFDDYSLSEVCVFDRAITAAAAREECFQPPCNFTIDLDAQDLSGLQGQDFRADTACFGPLPIAAPATLVRVGVPLDSLRITLSGVLNAGQEYLELNAAPNLSVFGSGTTTLTLVDDGTATFADFEAALSAIRYHNTAPAPAYGTRQARVQAFAWRYSSMESVAYLPISNLSIGAQIRTVDTVSCFGGADGALSVSGRGGTEPYVFAWPGGQQGDSLSGLSAGAYLLTVTDATGCRATDTLWMPQPDSIVVSLLPSAMFVCDSTGSITANATGGTEPYNWLWNNGSTASQISGIAAGTWSAALADANGCMALASLTLDGAASVTATQTVQSCRGEPYTFEGQSYSSDTLLCRTYSGLNGCDSTHCVSLVFLDTFYTQETVLLCPGESYDFNGLLLSGDTTACLVFTASNGCDSTHCIRTEVIRRESFNLAAICPGATYTFNNRVFDQAGTYTEIIPQSTGCDSVAVLALSFLPPPSVGLSASGSLCRGASVALNAAAGMAAYAWSGGSAGATLQISQPGWYRVTVTDLNGCTASDSILIADEAVRAQWSAEPPICAGLTGSVSASGITGGTPPYRHGRAGGLLQPVTEPVRLPAGTHRMVLEDANGCGMEQEIVVPAAPVWSLELGRDTSIRLGEAIRLQAQGQWPPEALLNWRPSEGLDCDTCAEVSAAPVRSTRYELVISIAPGCELRDALSIRTDSRTRVFVPGAFSPNGDGVNDRLSVFSDDGVQMVQRFSVFDRWGALVFEQRNFSPNDPANGWDGLVRQQAAHAGVYVWHIEWLRFDGETEKLSGESLLLR